MRLLLDLPIVVEVVVEETQIQEVLPELDEQIDGGSARSNVHVIPYRPHNY